MESKELEGIIQKVFSAGVGFERGQSMMEKGHLKMSPKDAVKNILAWHTAEVERAIDLFVKDMAGYDFTPGEESEDTNALVADAVQDSKNYVLSQLQPQPKKGQDHDY